MRPGPRIFNTALLLDRLSVVTPACLYAAGAAILAGKIFPVPAWLTPGVLLLAAAAVWLVLVAVEIAGLFGRGYSREYAAAWMDLRNNAGGRILSGAGDFDARVRPALRLRPLLRSLALPVLFVIVALLLPHWRPPSRPSGASLERRISRYERELEQKSDALSRPDAESLRKQLRQLHELAERNPEAAAEVLDSMPRRIDEAEARRLSRAAEAVEAANELGEKYNDAESAAGEDATATAKGGAPDSAEAAEEWEKMRRAMDEFAKGEGGWENMPDELRERWEDAAREDANAGENAKESTGSYTGENATGAGADAPDRERLNKMLEALQNATREMNRPAEGTPGAEQSQQGEPSDGGSPRDGGDSRNAASATARERLGSAAEHLERLRERLAEQAGAEQAAAGQGETGQGDAGASSRASAGGAASGGGDGDGGAGRGPGAAPLLFGNPSQAGDLGVDYRPLVPGESDDGDGLLLRRDRQIPDAPLAAEKYQAPWGSAVDAPDRVEAGRGASELGPARERAAREYFRRLREKQ